MAVSTMKGARFVACAAVIAVGLCTTTMNWHFGYRLGATELDSHILGAFSVALDVCKWLALGLAALAWQAKARLRATAGLAVWLVAVVYSLTAAFGFSALNRDTVTAARSDTAERTARARSAYKEASGRLSEAKASPRWAATSSCTDATASKSKEFCAKIAELEQIAATATTRLDTGTSAVADPQVSLFARTSGRSEDWVKGALAAGVALVAEVVSALGLFAVMAPIEQPKPVKGRTKKKRRKRKPKSPKPPMQAQAAKPRLVASN